jgi:hypothetical protein
LDKNPIGVPPSAFVAVQPLNWYSLAIRQGPMSTLPLALTPYHAKYYAYDLTRRCPPDSDDRLASALVDAQVDLNPHQVDAALFAFRSPLSRGVLLADEVGLGKTIEAGLVVAQKWAERKRRILVITPSNLRKQWHQELTDKFFLPCRILESKSYNAAVKTGQFRPFEIDDTVVICSYQFARNKAADRRIPFHRCGGYTRTTVQNGKGLPVFMPMSADRRAAGLPCLTGCPGAQGRRLVLSGRTGD